MEKIYRPSIRMDKEKEKKLKLLAKERGLSINKFFNIVAEEIIERYHSPDYLSFEDLKSTFILLESNLTIDLKAQEKKFKNPLKTYIYNKYTQESQRLGLYLTILFYQIYSEWRFLDLFFNKSDSDENFKLTYGNYYASTNEVGEQEFDSLHKKFEKIFLERWFYELKQNNIIEDLEDINSSNFNYKSLERFILNICRFKKMKKKKEVNFKNELEYAKRRKYLEKFVSSEPRLSVKKEIYNRFDGFMKLLVGEKENFDLNFIEFKPHIIFTRVLELERFLEFIEIDNSALHDWINILFNYFDYRILLYEIVQLDSSIEESYETLTKFLNNYREIYRIIKSRTSSLPNHIKIDKLRETNKLLNLSLENYNSFKEILTSLYFHEIAYYTDDLDNLFSSKSRK